MQGIMNSMGYDHEGDLFIIQEELKKKTKKKHPIFESSKPYNKPGSEQYGKGYNVSKYEITLKEAFHIYDSYMNDSTEILSLNKDYLKDEEMAFKNAVLFYCKEFYNISYEVKDHFHDVVHTDYFSLPFRQKPITNYFFPILENLINGDERVSKQERFQFTFLYNMNSEIMKTISEFRLDVRFFRLLMMNVMSFKMNQIGIHTRKFYSEDFKRVFMVAKCQDNVLRIRAEVILFPKRFQFLTFLANEVQYAD